MEITKKIFNFILIFLSVISVVMTSVYIYYVVTDKDLFTHSTATYSTSVTDPKTNEKVEPFYVSYYENYNNTGKEVVEFLVNSYSDYNRSALYSRGFQLIIDEKEGNQLYYYDTVYGLSFPSGHIYNETSEDGRPKEFFYIDINGEDEVYQVRLDGSYQVTTTKINGWKVVGAVTFGWLWFWGNGNNWNTTDSYQETYYYTMEDLLLKMKEIVKGSSYGVGDYTIPLIDLGDFLHIYEEGSDTPIGEGTLQNSYFAMKVHYDRRGITYADQSMFGSVANNSNFNVTGIDFDVNYWQSTIQCNLTEKDFESRYSTVDDGYYYYLSPKLIAELKTYQDMQIDIVFNISNLTDKNVLGFDYYALNGIEVNSLTIKSSTPKTINLLVGALQETGLTKIKVENVTINNLSGLEVEYEVV